MPALKKVEIKPGMKPVDFRLEAGKELRLRVIDRSGKPIPAVNVSIDKWRRGKSLYNHRHPNVLDTQIPFKTDETGLYLWSWAPGRRGDVPTSGRRVTPALRSRPDRDRLRTDGHLAFGPTDLGEGDGRHHGATDREADRDSGHRLRVPTAVSLNGSTRRRSPAGPTRSQGDRTDVAYRVRIEAEGYRSAMSEAVRAGAPSPTFDFRLEPAAPVRGQVIDTRGRPVEGRPGLPGHDFTNARHRAGE